MLSGNDFQRIPDVVACFGIRHADPLCPFQLRELPRSSSGINRGSGAVAVGHSEVQGTVARRHLPAQRTKQREAHRHTHLRPRAPMQLVSRVTERRAHAHCHLPPHEADDGSAALANQADRGTQPHAGIRTPREP